MQTTFIAQEKVFTSQKDARVGDWPVHKGDHLKVIERGDGLWNVLINERLISFAIDGTLLNDLAGFKLAEA
jgi:hypothetical protein